jgi:hypothetical protein
MARWLTYLKAPWTTILVTSVLIFVFWDGPGFTATSLSHSGRLMASYLFIPLAVAAVLLWQKKWNWGTFGYVALGLALIKMVITMGVHLWVIPRGARMEVRPLQMEHSLNTSYLATDSLTTGELVVQSQDTDTLLMALLNIHRGRAPERSTRTVNISQGIPTPALVIATSGDSISIQNHDTLFHTYELRGPESQLLQVPLPPGSPAMRKILRRHGAYTSRCAQHGNTETMQLIVFDHPYWILAAGNGAFTHIPEGTYDLGVWHTRGMLLDISRPDRTIPVTIKAEQTADVRLDRH